MNSSAKNVEIVCKCKSARLDAGTALVEGTHRTAPSQRKPRPVRSERKFQKKASAHGGVNYLTRAFYSVYNRLGHGLAEVEYEREMAAELRGRGCAVASQRSARVRYGRQKRGRFRPELVVDERVVVEIKARSRILNSHWAQLLHYLRVTGVEVGLILNFGPRPEFKRLDVQTAGKTWSAPFPYVETR